MATTYTKCEMRSSSYSSSGTLPSGGKPLTVKTTVNQQWQIITSGDLVSETTVACQAGLPQVGYSAFYSPSTGQVMYNAICTGKTVKRSPKNKSLFIADITYSTPHLSAEACFGSPVATLDDIEPTVTASVSGRDRVLYEDYSSTPQQCFKQPFVKVIYDSPVVTKDPNVTLTITQFEDAITYDQMQERSFVVNSDTYNTLPAGRWLCKVTSAVEQSVALSDGNGGVVQTDVVKVTYAVERNDSSYKNLSGTKVVTGWDQQVPLVSPKFINDEGEIERFTDATNGEQLTDYINLADGTKRSYTEGGVDDRPDYRTFQNYPRVAFQSFLQI